MKKISEVTWKEIGRAYLKHIKGIGKNGGSLLTLVVFAIIVVGRDIWRLPTRGTSAVWRAILRGIDTNPRTSVTAVIIVLTFVIMAQFVGHRLTGEIQQRRMDSLMMVNDTLKNYSMYDYGYSHGYRDANAFMLRQQYEPERR